MNDDDVKIVFRVLSESVATRLREQGLKGRTVTISVRNKDLEWFTRQVKMKSNTDIATEILDYAMRLFKANYNWDKPIRSLGVSVSDFYVVFEQFDFCNTVENREKQEKIETVVDTLRKRFGNYCITRASQLNNTELSRFNPHDEHIIHPIGFR